MRTGCDADRPGPALTAWSRAVSDIVTGACATHLWARLGRQDIRGRYRRSVLGPAVDHAQHGHGPDEVRARSGDRPLHRARGLPRHTGGDLFDRHAVPPRVRRLPQLPAGNPPDRRVALRRRPGLRRESRAAPCRAGRTRRDPRARFPNKPLLERLCNTAVALDAGSMLDPRPAAPAHARVGRNHGGCGGGRLAPPNDKLLVRCASGCVLRNTDTRVRTA